MSFLARAQRLRRAVKHDDTLRYAILGDENGNINGLGELNLGKVYVRFQGGTDANGDVAYLPSVLVNSGGNNYPVYPGIGVWVGFDPNGEYTIKEADSQDMRNAEIDSRALNSAEPSKAFVYLRNVWRLVSRPVGQVESTSTYVYVNPLVYMDNYGDFNAYPGTPTLSDKIDLSSFIPTSGNHRIAVVAYDTVNEATQTVASTTQAMTSALDSTDYQECFDQFNAETIPIQAYLLQNAADSIDVRDLKEDLRQFVNMPQALGFPNPVDKQKIIRSGQTETVFGAIFTTDTLFIQGTLFNSNRGDFGSSEKKTAQAILPVYKSYTVTTQGLGANPDVYAAGYLEYALLDTTLTQASTTQTFGDANVSHAAHAFAVFGGAGTVDTGVIGLRVNGTSITDAGVRTTSDTETIAADITAVALNEWTETDKKWLGQVTYELFVVSGAPTAYSLDFNYGYAKYEDFGNNNFTITDIECVGLAGANDNTFDIKLFHYRATGWTYAATGFDPITAANTVASLATDHSTDDQLVANDHFAWKRANLTEGIAGAGSEGVIIRVESSANNAVEYCNLHLGVRF